jgi:ATP-dependent helicase/nuclease subunit A
MKPAAYSISGQAAEPASFYAAACDPSRSVVVEACAGAGKTWILVSRVLRALLAGTEPQHILAITYTRKAAGEMRSRLDEWLLAFSASHSSHDDRVAALRQRGLTAAEAEQQAPALAQLRAQLLQAARPVDMRTFHGWFAQLLSHAPLAVLQALKLPAAYELIEDNKLLQDALMRRFHRAVQADPALRTDYVALVGRHRRTTVLSWLVAAWQHGPELQRADNAGTAETSVPAAAQLWPQCQGLSDPAQLVLMQPLQGELAALAKELGSLNKGEGKPATAASELLEALAAPTGSAAFVIAWAALFTQKNEPRKHLGNSPRLASVGDALRTIKAMQAQQAAHTDHLALLRLSRCLLAEYATLKRLRGLVDMPDIERAAELMLGDSSIAGWVQERLDQRVHQVLIDEFQDTNPLQWQVLRSWLSAYAGAGGGASGQRPPSVFIVGDPKQSIYRFRGAEPRVFAAARDFVVQGLHGVLLACDHTRRNAPAVLDVVNAVFEEAARLDAWGPYRAHSTESAAAGAVLRLPGVKRPPSKAALKRAAQDTEQDTEQDGAATVSSQSSALDAQTWRDSLTQPRYEPELRLRAQEAAQAAQAVNKLMQQHHLAPGEIMVLARKRDMLAFVAQALAALHVPHVVGQALALHEDPVALDLVALLDVLASPGHNLALARALKSPLFSASDDDLLLLAGLAQQQQKPWLSSLLLAPENSLPATLLRARHCLGSWRGAAQQLPPHDLLDRIVFEGQVLARMAAAVPAALRAGAQHAVNALLAASLSHGAGRFTTLYGFVRDLRAGRVRAPSVAPSQAVQLLTVHSAKGLESRAVVVVDSDPAPGPSERALVLVDWPVDKAAPQRVAFVLNQAHLAPSLQDAWLADSQARQREEINGLYVAMTRAREWLVFSRTEPPKNSNAPRSWWARVATHAQAFDNDPHLAAAEAQPPEAVAQAVVDVPTLPSLSWQAAPPVSSKTSASGAGGSAKDVSSARLGQAVHRVLEWAGRPGAPLAAAQLPSASVAAAAAFGLDAAAGAQVLAVAQAVLTSPACARFFTGSQLAWAGNEVPLAATDAGGVVTLRIDRLVALRAPDAYGEGEGAALHWWVLDYKLQADPAALASNREQLARYVAAVQALQPSDRVSGAFITGRGELVQI